MSNKIRIEYTWDGYLRKYGDSRCMSRSFNDIEQAAHFVQSLFVPVESLRLLVDDKEFNWPEKMNDVEILKNHLEYCLDFMEAFYDV